MADCGNRHERYTPGECVEFLIAAAQGEAGVLDVEAEIETRPVVGFAPAEPLGCQGLDGDTP